MRKQMHRGLAAFLVWAALVAGCQERVIPQEVPASTPAELEALVSQMNTDKEWSASSRLQKLGAPAVAALVAHLRQDPFADRDHGHHSSTMKVLERIGEPALPALADALTPALLQSADADDVRLAASLIMVMARISRSRAAPHLARVARSAVSPELRANALDGMLGGERYAPPLSRPGMWQTCVILYWAYLSGDRCPDDAEAGSMAAALQPVLPEISAVLGDTSAPDVRLMAAHLLARWGTGTFKSRGERELLTLSGNAPPETRNEAIQSLGMLQVRSSADSLQAQAADADEDRKRAIVEALFRLNHRAYVMSAAELMGSKDDQTRRWSIELARASHDISFVPHLIDHLDDRGWNGVTTTQSPPGQKPIVTRGALADDALEALRRLTFEDLGVDKVRWRRWLETNRTTSWESLLNRFVQSPGRHRVQSGRSASRPARSLPEVAPVVAGPEGEFQRERQSRADRRRYPDVNRNSRLARVFTIGQTGSAPEGYPC